MKRPTLDAIAKLINQAEALHVGATPTEIGTLQGLATIARIKLETYEDIRIAKEEKVCTK